MVPDTPAGKTLGAFLDAFNSADRAKVDTYVQTFDPAHTADDLLAFRAETGGFTLLSIEASAPAAISFRVKGRTDNRDAFGNLQLASIDPPKVKSWNIRALPPGAILDSKPLDAAARQQTVDAVARQLTAFYVYPALAAKMNAAIADHSKHGDYSGITDGGEFAQVLTRDLRAVSHDGHLRVDYQPFKMPGAPATSEPHRPSAAEIALDRQELERSNCEFKKIEVLPGNIGYLKFDEFADPAICGPTVTAAMNFLAHTDALIIDLRENGGGDPEMVQLVASYLFDHPTHINDIYDRHEDSTHQSWTLAFVSGPRIAAPVYVLTARRTFSGAEEFTYDLQTQKRATVIGEVTGGGAHPVRGYPAGDHFMIGVPFARAINPITHKDWEGTGVEPDIKVPAADALATAQKLAADRLAAK